MKSKPKIIRFFARNGSGIDDDRAAVYGKELVRLERGKKRALKASEVVDASRSPSSPLHEPIWSESEKEAAHQRRLYLARSIINAIRIEWEVKEGRIVNSPLWVNFQVEPKNDRTEGEYRNIEFVLGDPDSRATMLENAMEEMLTFRKKWEALTELSGVFREMDAAIQKIVGKIELATSKKE